MFLYFPLCKIFCGREENSVLSANKRRDRISDRKNERGNRVHVRETNIVTNKGVFRRKNDSRDRIRIITCLCSKKRRKTRKKAGAEGKNPKKPPRSFYWTHYPHISFKGPASMVVGGRKTTKKEPRRGDPTFRGWL